MDLKTSKWTGSSRFNHQDIVDDFNTLEANESARLTEEAARVARENARNLDEVIRQSNEETRVDSETTRNTNESARQSHESTRQGNENIRINTENARIGAENTREADEDARHTAETSRVTAENQRANAESTRNSNESARIAAENTRTSSESSRTSAESNRAVNETARQNAENTRSSNENTRASNESGRVSAESTRVSNENNRITKYTQMEQQWNNVQTAAANSNIASSVVTEVISARTDTDGNNYSTIGNRIDTIQDKVKTIGATEASISTRTLLPTSVDGIGEVKSIEGAVIKNLVKNGDFSNGTTNWNGYNSTINVSNKELIVTSNNAYAVGLIQDTNGRIKENDKIYLRTNVKADNSDCVKISIEVNGTDQPNSSTFTVTFESSQLTNLKTLSSLYTVLPTHTGNLRFSVWSYYTSSEIGNGKSIYVSNPLAVNLTELFGAGKEPTKEWCDENLVFVNGMVGAIPKSVKSVGKNLFDSVIENGVFELTNGTKAEYGGYVRSANYIPVAPNVSYTLSSPTGISDPMILFYDGNNKFISYSNISPNNAVYAMFYAQGTIDKQFQFEQGSVQTSYESYKESTITLPTLTESLKALPNGVKDTMDIANGKVIRRVGKVVLNGSESWYNAVDGTNYFTFYTDNIAIKGFDGLSDKFLCTAYTTTSSYEAEGFLPSSQFNVIYIRIAKNKLSSVDATGFKTWLSQNPTTVFYELATPVEESIGRIENILASYNSSTIIPEANIPSTVKYQYPTNLTSSVKAISGVVDKLTNNVEVLTSKVDDNVNQQVTISTIGRTTGSIDSIGQLTTIEGRTAKNLVKNGDFSSGTSWWTARGNHSGTIASNGQLNIIASGEGNTAGAGDVYQDVGDTTIGNKFYFSCNVKNNGGGLCDFNIIAKKAWISVTQTISNSWSKVSCIVDSDVTGRYLHLYATNVGAGANFFIDDVTLVNLTELFGAGKEPSKEWCDENLTFVNGLTGAIPTEVKTTGKNLIDLTKAINFTNGLTNWVIGDSIFVDDEWFASIPVKVKPNTIYTIQAERIVDNGSGIVGIYNADVTQPILADISVSSISFYTGNNTKISVLLYANHGVRKTVEFKNVQLEEGTTPTTYEPYKSSEVTIPTIESLKALPNGVKDTVDVVNGKVTRRIGKVVFNGSESWALSGGADGTDVNTIGFQLYLDSLARTTSSNIVSSISDKFPSISQFMYWVTDSEGICSLTDGNAFRLRINKSKLSTQDVNGFKAWLTANPTTVYYELATPVTEDIAIDDAIATYQNGTMYVEGNIPTPVTLKYPTNLISTVNTLVNVTDDLSNTKANKRQEAWISPTLLNGWVNYGTGYADTGYYKDELGRVHIKGLVKNGIIGSDGVFILPIGCRPSVTIQFPVTSSNAFGFAEITPTGFVRATIGDNNWFSFNGISFRAEG